MQLFEWEQTDSPTTYRRRALMEYGAFCDMCGYSKYVEMLEVNHRDHNRKNNKLENLEVLCSWCHKIETMKVPWHKWEGAEFKK